VIAQEVTLVPEIHGCPQEEPSYAEVAHPLETPVGGIDTAAYDCESLALHFLAQPIILGEMNFLVESAEFPEFLSVKKHEHTRRKRTMHVGEVLEEIVAGVEELVDPGSVCAQDVRGDAVQLLSLRALDAFANEAGLGEFDVGIEESTYRVSACAAP
jgi:hypothetical protein